jgi:hypothetical protein
MLVAHIGTQVHAISWSEEHSEGRWVFIIVRVREWCRKAQKSIFQLWHRIPIRPFSAKNGKEMMQLGFITTKLHAILSSVEYSERRGVFIVVAKGRT